MSSGSFRLSEWRGDWAVVTGASSGLGREFARALAGHGLNLVLVARRLDRIAGLAEELQSLHKVRAIPAPLDLSLHDGATNLKSLVNGAGIRPRLLCNMAAFGRWGHAEDTDGARYRQMLLLNASAVVELCLIFRDDLRSFPSSAIINASSQAAFQPVPYMGVYAASKAFVHSFSLALHEEWRKDGIAIQTLVPGPTATEFDEIAGAYETKLKQRADPATVIAKALFDLEKNLPLCFAGASGVFRQRLFGALLPTRMLLREVAKLFQPPKV